jgi:hypothetical protein
MPFSSTFRNMSYNGAGATTVSGEWTGVAGDAAGSMTVSGIVTRAIFQGFNTGATCEIVPRVSSSVSGAITTLTIENQDNVTTGYFVIDKIG